MTLPNGRASGARRISIVRVSKALRDVNETKPRVLIVDDEPMIRELLAQILSVECSCVTSESAEAALEEFRAGRFDLVISDVNLGGMSGVEMVPRIQSLSPETVVMMISGAHSVDTAIDAMRVGVFDYVRKPFEQDQVIAAVRRALTHQESLAAQRRHERELASLVEKKTAELHHIAHHDALTGLPNETLFKDRLANTLAGCDLNQKAAIILICISSLRVVRDSIGLAAANEILLDASRRLLELSDADLLARFEGDKFAMLVPRTQPDRVVEVANAVSEALTTPFTVDDQDIHAQANLGISMFPTDGTDTSTLIRNAGAALSRAESKGSGSEFYSAEINARAIRQLALENNLRRALERNELSVLYQPKIDIRSRRIVGMEALLRWNSDELGPVPPDVFIPIAESTEVIIKIGEWVLRTACLQAKSWHEEGFPLNLAVNLSARQFRDRDLSMRILNILDQSGLDAHYLNLEVTESSLVDDPTSAVEILMQLQKLGISISIDDFGTGHSSLGYLRSLPIDVLKIDKSFIRNVTTEPDAATLVKAMITLAHDLRLRVVAEGVETEDQLETLSRLECDEWQGFLKSKPLHPDEFAAALRNDHAR